MGEAFAAQAADLLTASLGEASEQDADHKKWS